MRDDDYMDMFQIGVTPEMLGEKEMSVKELRLNNADNSIRLVIREDEYQEHMIIEMYEPNSWVELPMDRNQTHLLYLYLKERFEP